MNNKHIFWQALVVSLVIFSLGFVLGFFLESYRIESIQTNLILSEANLLDEQLRLEAIGRFGINCSSAKFGLFDFADRVYYEALSLESYGKSSQLKSSFFVLHKKYDLLRTLLWMESLSLRERCGNDFHTVVYLYYYDEQNSELRAEQLYFSRLLREFKERNPEEVLLVPIAVNTELSSLDLIISKYGVNNFPAVIVDENHVLTEIVSTEELEKIVFESIVKDINN